MPLPTRVAEVSHRDRAVLETLLRARTTAQRVVERAKIVLASHAGHSGNTICQTVGVSRPTVTLWLDRYEVEGVEGLLADRSRSGRPKSVTPEMEAEIIDTTLHTAPPEGTHWSTRRMATETGLNHATIARIWRAHGVQPHRFEYFKLSSDPRFVTKPTW